jgi:hypothetical protein
MRSGDAKSVTNRRIDHGACSVTDRKQAFAVPGPGDDLREAILDGAKAKCPTWGVPTFETALRVPRLERVPGDAYPSGRRPLINPHEAGLEDARMALSRDALVALRTDHPEDVAHALGSRHPQDQLRALVVAALLDVAGFPLDHEAYAKIGYESEYNRERTVQKAANRGRQLWAKLAAWPWWALGPRSGPLGIWWTEPRVVEAFTAWRDPDRWHAANRASV